MQKDIVSHDYRKLYDLGRGYVLFIFLPESDISFDRIVNYKSLSLEKL